MENNISTKSFSHEEAGSTNFLEFDQLSVERPTNSFYDDPFDPLMETSLSNENLYLSSSSNPLCSSNYLMHGSRQNQNAAGIQNYPTSILFEALKQDQTYQSLDHQGFRSTNENVSDELPSLTLEGDHHTKPSSKKKKNVQPKETKKCPGNSNLVKGSWTAEEDRTLAQLVKQFGEKNWSQMATILNGRVGKQCRERWRNHLRPNIKRDVWTEEEEKILIEAHKKLGNKWAEIARMMTGRTENAIKNHWNATKRKRFSRGNGGNSSSHLKEYINSTLSRPDSAAANIDDHPLESPSLDFALKMDDHQTVPTTLDSDDHLQDDKVLDFSFESLLDEVGMGICGSLLEESNGDGLEIPKDEESNGDGLEIPKELDLDVNFDEENEIELLEKFCPGIF